MRILIGLVCVLSLASCSGSAPPPSSGLQAAAPPGGRGSGGGVPVSVATVVEESIPINLRAVGNVESSSTVEIRSQVTGALLSMEFREGQDVAAGDLLFTLDPRPFDVALKQAEAQLAKDAGQSKNAEVQRARATDLLSRGVLAKSDFDTIAAQANALLSSMALDNVQIENARLQLQYTKIRAPLSGRTGAFLVHPGALIRANDTAPMVVINQIAPVFVSFAVPSSALPSLRAGRAAEGLRVEATVAGSDEVSLPAPSVAKGKPDTTPGVGTAPGGASDGASTGSVTFIDNAVDPTTDTIRVKAKFPNSDHRLWPGQFAEVTLRLSVDSRAIVAPAVAVQPSQQGTFVWVVGGDQTVVARPVTVARTAGDKAIIGRGLAAGEVVVTDGQLRLTPNARVSVKSTGARGSS